MPHPHPPGAIDKDILLAFELAPIGLCVTKQRVIQCCNPHFAAMFGYPAEELLQKSVECLYPSHVEFVHIGDRGLDPMKKSGLYSDERIMRRRSGELFWCHVSGRSLVREDPFACAVWMFEDLSALRPVSIPLTSREREVAQFLATGGTAKQIARALSISPRTVEAHRARMMRKVGASTTSELVARLVGFSK
jgi:PAS domain S-box-containing protein